MLIRGIRIKDRSLTLYICQNKLSTKANTKMLLLLVRRVVVKYGMQNMTATNNFFQKYGIYFYYFFK